MSAPTLAPCGTHAAYVRHRARGEEACPPCKRANAERSRAIRAASRPPLSPATCRDCGGHHADAVDGVRCDLATHGEPATRRTLARFLPAQDVEHLIGAAR